MAPYVYAVLDFRLQLSATDYGNFLANEPLPLSTATIGDKVCRGLGFSRFIVHFLTPFLLTGYGETRGRVQLHSNECSGAIGDVHGLYYVSSFRLKPP